MKAIGPPQPGCQNAGIVTFLLVVLLSFWAQPGNAQQNGPSAETMARVAHSVVQIIARDCSGASRTGSGFLWGNSQQAVTALHVVTGCKHIFAFDKQHGEVEAAPSRQLLGADLVLLRLNKDLLATPLLASRTDPAVNDTVQAIGYYYGVPTLDNRRLSVTMGATHLEDMLTETLTRSIKAAGSPDVSVHIIRMDGHLLPGLSGAPVINTAGQVVGIGSGGLADGAAGVSWAIASSYLKDLPAGQPFQAGRRDNGAGTHVFFSSEEGFSGSATKCGDVSFTRLRSSTIGDLAKSTDNPLGFVEIASNGFLPAEQVAAIPMDVYVEPDSGGSVPIPAGAELTEVNGMCRIAVADGKYVVWIASAHFTSPLAIPQIKTTWETTLSRTVPMRFVENPNFSYSHPTTREADGLMVNRTAYLLYKGLSAKGAAFETLLARKDTMIGVFVSNLDLDRRRYQQCSQSPTARGCAQVNADYLQWGAALFGTILATFPPQ